MYIRGASGVVYGAGDENPPLPIDDKGLLIIGNATLDQLRIQKHQWHKEDDEQFGDWVSLHFSSPFSLGVSEPKCMEQEKVRAVSMWFTAPKKKQALCLDSKIDRQRSPTIYELPHTVEKRTAPLHQQIKKNKKK